ncbi:hypothetical protein Hypma_006078 [Hypsizygus marmoreus]|uniref:Uncharacterized protein n=1 Tax=Hypsizygus marmoreus TaxID=39966 RepID=A0A369JV88_HYPMA|nr:hypothetical protein Hypma_006078 [Hypsizygus marmoreus]
MAQNILMTRLRYTVYTPQECTTPSTNTIAELKANVLVRWFTHSVSWHNDNRPQASSIPRSLQKKSDKYLIQWDIRIAQPAQRTQVKLVLGPSSPESGWTHTSHRPVPHRNPMATPPYYLMLDNPDPDSPTASRKPNTPENPTLSPPVLILCKGDKAPEEHT